MLDASVLNKLAELVEKVTDKSRLDIDPISLQQLKLLCKASDDNVTEVFDLLLDRLKASDAQVCCSTCTLLDLLQIPCWCRGVAHESPRHACHWVPLVHPWTSMTHHSMVELTRSTKG